MFPLSLGLLTAVAAVAQPPAAAPKEARVYELRVYYAPEGKLDALNARFRDHTTKLFAKHGITNVGYWVPIDNGKENKLVYVLSYPDLAARKRAWDAFVVDPDWLAAKKASEAGGPIVMKVDSTFLALTDYSPAVAPSAGGPERVFELRTYTATSGNAEALHDRFRSHTVKLFEKHGMTNLWYWTPVPGPKGETPETSLVYLLAHKSKEARDASFAAFRADPAWQEVLKASEAKAGGPLTVKETGVRSELLKPTDYSPIK